MAGTRSHVEDTLLVDCMCRAHTPLSTIAKSTHSFPFCACAQVFVLYQPQVRTSVREWSGNPISFDGSFVPQGPGRCAQRRYVCVNDNATHRANQHCHPLPLPFFQWVQLCVYMYEMVSCEFMLGMSSVLLDLFVQAVCTGGGYLQKDTLLPV